MESRSDGYNAFNSNDEMEMGWDAAPAKSGRKRMVIHPRSESYSHRLESYGVEYLNP